jgi:OmcA/MtrC family decaheme c-type cytochrome
MLPSTVRSSTPSLRSSILAGPTKSYRQYFRESAAARAQFDPATGNTTFTFTAKIPADAVGSWTISGDFYRNATIQRASPPPGQPETTTISVREAAFNPIHYFAVTGTEVEPRRAVTTQQLCNNCHDRLAIHGGQRQNVMECVICHNPVTTDANQRPDAQEPNQSVSMQYMIHRIHTGHELTRDFTVYGNGASVHNYNGITYPQDRRNCVACHVNGTQQLPGQGDPVVTPRDFFSPMGPGTAACLGCHDSQDAAAHAFLNTANFPGSTKPAEACASCHGPGKEHSVDASHAR